MFCILLNYPLDVDPDWISCLRTKQFSENLKQTRNSASPLSCSDNMSLPQFLTAFGNQSSYASAVRRSPNRSPLSLWTSSRSSSPTLSTKLSNLHLGSKGSSPSSTTSESTLEREHPRSNRSMYSNHRTNSFSNSLSLGGGGERRVSKGACHTNHGGSKGGRPRTNYVVPQSQSRIIPGIATITGGEKQKEEAEDAAKATEGGWIKVERKKPSKQDQRQYRNRPRRGGRGGGGRGWN